MDTYSRALEGEVTESIVVHPTIVYLARSPWRRWTVGSGSARVQEGRENHRKRSQGDPGESASGLAGGRCGGEREARGVRAPDPSDVAGGALEPRRNSGGSGGPGREGVERRSRRPLWNLRRYAGRHRRSHEVEKRPGPLQAPDLMFFELLLD